MNIQNSDILSELEFLTNRAKNKMWVHGILGIINLFLTIVSISLHVTDKYTHDHIIMYLFTSLMSALNCYYNSNTYIKLKPLKAFVNPGDIKEILRDISCVGFYESIINGMWLVVAIIMEAVIIADNISNKQQAFLIVELILVICVAGYNLVATCKTSFKSHDNAKLVDLTVLNIMNGDNTNV